MSFLLRRGATPQLALDALEQSIRRLDNAVGSYPSSPAVEYVKGVQEVEVFLGNAFDRSWVAETFLTPLYWYLMDVAHLTLPYEQLGERMPGHLEEWEWEAAHNRKRKAAAQIGPANNGADRERYHQIERLQQIKADVEELAVFANAGGKILIIDTNTLMHAYPLEQIQWSRNGIAAGELVRALVPLAVVDELDRKKFEGGDNMRRRAATAIRSLYGHRKGLKPDVPSSFITTDNSTLALEIPRDDLGRTRSAATDDEIRDFGMFVKQVTGRPVTVVTRDMGLQVRCERAGLETLWLDDKDMRQDQPGGGKSVAS